MHDPGRLVVLQNGLQFQMALLALSLCQEGSSNGLQHFVEPNCAGFVMLLVAAGGLSGRPLWAVSGMELVWGALQR